MDNKHEVSDPHQGSSNSSSLENYKAKAQILHLQNSSSSASSINTEAKHKNAPVYTENNNLSDMTQGEYDLIHRDLERVADSEIIPQRRLFSIFYSRKLPDIPQSDEERKFVPLKTWNLLNTVFFGWCFRLLQVGYKRTIQPNDLMRINNEYLVENLYNEFLINWEESLERKRKRKLEGKPDPKYEHYSILVVLLKTFKWRYGYAIFSMIIANLAVAFTPLVSKHLIAFVAEKQVVPGLKLNKGVGYAIATIVLMIIIAIFSAQGMFNASLVGAQIRSILTKALLQKSFKLSSKGKHEFPLSKITTIATTDTSRVEIGFTEHPMIWGFPGAIIVTIYLLIYNIGPVALVGLGYFLVSLGVTVWGFTFVMGFREIANQFTDARVNFVRDIINALKIIKFYAWEDAYLKLIAEKRKREINQVRKMQSYQAVVIAYSVMVPTIASLITFLCLYQIKHGNKSAAAVFSSLALFKVLSGQMFIIPQALSSTVDALVGMKRVQACLLAEEAEEGQESEIPCLNKENAIELDRCTYEWEVFEDAEESNSDENLDEKNTVENNNDKLEKNSIENSMSAKDEEEPIDKPVFNGLHDITLNIRRGEFIVVTGSIGTGKSSLLLAMTHLMKQLSGEYRQNGELLLCGQPWVQNATIRDNITFGSDYDEKKYKNVLDICSLRPDLKILEAGDLTEIGERGINLSGGQKARINLGRTVYRSADIYLFDDILSAVDAKVGKHIMEKCIMGELKNKTRLLATHQLNLIKDADRIIFLGTDGSLTIDTMDNLLLSKPEFANLMANATTSKKDNKESNFKDAEEEEEEEEVQRKEIQMKNIKSENDEFSVDIAYDEKQALIKGQLIDKEERAVNSISFDVYKKYLVAGAGSFWLIATCLFFFADISNTFMDLFASVWLSFWNEMKWKNRSKGFYMGLYALWTVLSFFLTLGECLIILKVGLRSSRNLHNSAIKRVLHAPMSFIDVTPLGRILNRFTKDMDVLDSQLPISILIAMYSIVQIGGIIIMCIIYIPWFAISLPPFILFFLIIFDHYQSSAREVKRLEAVQRSFVFNNFNEVLSGLDTIKSYKLTDAFLRKNDFLTDKQNEATVMYMGLQKWSSVWIVLISVCLSTVIIFLCISRTFSIGAASTGLLLNYVLELAEALKGLLYETTQLENYMNSVERVVTYTTDLPQEKAYHIAEMKPAENWPQEAHITFENVSLSYRPGLPLVLKNFNVDVKGGEKIGICGRTGAGKSTIMSALYRLVELSSGRVLIDGVDISKIGLYDLRSKLSIIPQEAILFKGDIKRNLDPFDESTDEELWDALVKGGAIEASELNAVKQQKVVEGSKNNEMHKFHLYQNVDDEGANFSLGERQLLTLARALVRKSKILILDEATSSVDYETDAKIQAKIAEGFSHSTILCIAHRLKTIVKYDKILVLDKGEVKEFDTPLNLFTTEGTIFREMCLRSGITETDFAS
ncbi:hypothetical protein ACO0QE_002606 [Hanseniaspora vineae]